MSQGLLIPLTQNYVQITAVLRVIRVLQGGAGGGKGMEVGEKQAKGGHSTRFRITYLLHGAESFLKS